MINEEKPLTKNNKKIFKVAELTNNIKEILETKFSNIWVEGEISDIKRPSSGHIYFTLKDESSQIKAVMFRFRNQNLRFKLEDGLKIVCFGTISVYEKRGEYQIIIEVAEPLGLGALQLAFENLKKKLYAEGLFNTERKRPIPLFPQKIGIVTSPTGAAIRDMLNVTKRRFCNIHIIINPVRVQGPEAPDEIAEAIRELNKFNDIDVIIIGRGGGSLEDLWAFNEEVVARAIYESKIPIISAVGHEIDFTISDFVADLRAPTPSAAAELVVQNKTVIENNIKIHKERIVSSINNIINVLKNEVQHLAENKCLVKPQEIIQDKYQQIDEYLDKIQKYTKNYLENRNEKVNSIYDKLLYLGPVNKIPQMMEKNNSLTRSLTLNIEHVIDKFYSGVNNLSGKLNALSPLAILTRGYSLTFILPEKKLLTNSQDVAIGNEIEIKLAQGEITCEVKKVS